MFSGSMVALVTPFSGSCTLDLKSLKNLIQWHIEEGTDAIVCCGTTGEAPTLSKKEKMKIIEICVREAKGKSLIVAGTGTNCTKTSVELTREAQKIGADGCMVVVPYYNKPNPRGIIEHFRRIAEVGLPLIIYHHPGRTSVTVSAETFSALARIPHIVAVKEASLNLDKIREIKESCDLGILSGDDNLTIDIIKLGGKGVVSVVANIIPSLWKQIVSLALNNNFKRAGEIKENCQPIIEAMMLETNPQCVKYALSLLRRCTPQLRLPLVQPSFQTKRKIEEALKNGF